MPPQPPKSKLFPYTTLFRSRSHAQGRRRDRKFGRRLAGQDSDGMLERSEEHTSELQSHSDLVCRLLLEKKNENKLIRQKRITNVAVLVSYINCRLSGRLETP